MRNPTKEFESWLVTGAKYGTAWEAWQHQAARIAELEAQVKQLQRVPLSDEDIFNLYCQSDSVMDTTTTNLILFARAIEAAHNITPTP